MFGNVSDLHGHVHRNLVANLQHNASLRITLKAAGTHFKTVWAHREVWEKVKSTAIGSGCAGELFFRFGDLYRGVGDRGAARIGDDSRDLRDGNSLTTAYRRKHGGGRKQQSNPQ